MVSIPKQFKMLLTQWFHLMMQDRNRILQAPSVLKALRSGTDDMDAVKVRRAINEAQKVLACNPDPLAQPLRRLKEMSKGALIKECQKRSIDASPDGWYGYRSPTRMKLRSMIQEDVKARARKFGNSPCELLTQDKLRMMNEFIAEDTSQDSIMPQAKRRKSKCVGSRSS